MPQITKILYLVTQSEIGGAQRYIFDLATNLKQSGYEIAVAASGNQELFSLLKEKSIVTYPLKHLVREINPVKDWLAYLEIKQLLRQVKPDILHLNSSKAGVLGSLAGRAAGIKKIIYTVHGFVFNEPMPGWQKWSYKFAEKFSGRFKDKLICVSEFDRSTGIKNRIVPTEKLITIHNGIAQPNFLSLEQARNELLATYQLPATSYHLIIGTIANFYPTKGLGYLIEAAKLVCEKNDKIIFGVIGDGPNKSKLTAEIKNQQLEKNFLLLGSKQNAWRYLKAFDFYICSSVKEGFPYSILEAMAAGLPLVSTNVGGILEMIENKKSGLLVKPAEPKELAEVILELSQNKNLAAALGRQAAMAVKEKFNLEKMIAETKKVYQV